MDSKAFSPEILQAIINKYQKVRPKVSYEHLDQPDRTMKNVGKEGWQVRTSEKAQLQKKKASSNDPQKVIEEYMAGEKFDPEIQYKKETEFFRDLDKTPTSKEFTEKRKKEYLNAILTRMKTA